MKNIISVKVLKEYYKKHPDAKVSLETWIATTKKADWKKPSDVVETYPSADPSIGNDRAVFNIAHNKYRLVVKISYPRQWVFIRFIGTHSEYDRIDPRTI